jgi:hypothetical protein
MNRFKQAIAEDILGVLGIALALIGLIVYAAPIDTYTPCGVASAFPTPITIPNDCYGRWQLEWFSTERLPVAGAFGFVAVILLLLRRR